MQSAGGWQCHRLPFPMDTCIRLLDENKLCEKRNGDILLLKLWCITILKGLHNNIRHFNRVHMMAVVDSSTQVVPQRKLILNEITQRDQKSIGHGTP